MCRAGLSDAPGVMFLEVAWGLSAGHETLQIIVGAGSMVMAGMGNEGCKDRGVL
jgi:hypothetical protein